MGPVYENIIARKPSFDRREDIASPMARNKIVEPRLTSAAKRVRRRLDEEKAATLNATKAQEAAKVETFIKGLIETSDDEDGMPSTPAEKRKYKQQPPSHGRHSRPRNVPLPPKK